MTVISKTSHLGACELSGFFDTFFEIMVSTGKGNSKADKMKGYSVESGYMGLVDGRYMLFACEEDYRDYLSD